MDNQPVIRLIGDEFGDCEVLPAPEGDEELVAALVNAPQGEFALIRTDRNPNICFPLKPGKRSCTPLKGHQWFEVVNGNEIYPYGHKPVEEKP